MTTVVEVTAFEGALNATVPGVAVLAGLDPAFGAVAVDLLSRAARSDVR